MAGQIFHMAEFAFYRRTPYKTPHIATEHLEIQSEVGKLFVPLPAVGNVSVNKHDWLPLTGNLVVKAGIAIDYKP